MSVHPIQPFLDRLTDWADKQDNILAAALVGSYVRGTARPDSDVDLMLIVRDPTPYLVDTGWAQRFGTAARQQLENYGKVTSLRVWYTDGLEIEFGLTDPTWSALPLDEGTRGVISDGLRVLYERAPILSAILPLLEEEAPL